MHAVDEINVSMAGRSPEDVIACGAAGSGVRGSIVSAQIGFHLHDPSGDELAAFFANDELSQKVRRDDARIAIEELSRENFCFGGRT